LTVYFFDPDGVDVAVELPVLELPLFEVLLGFGQTCGCIAANNSLASILT
jgi:hypothetical protein